MLLYLTQLSNMTRASAKEPQESLEAETAREVLDVIPHVMRQIRAEMREMAKPQLTIPQMRTLARVSRESGTVSELAEWLGVSAPAMSKMLAILERRGLVARAAQGQDRRQVNLTATDEGRRLTQNMRGGVRVKIAERLKSLPDSEKQVV